MSTPWLRPLLARWFCPRCGAGTWQPTDQTPGCADCRRTSQLDVELLPDRGR